MVDARFAISGQFPNRNGVNMLQGHCKYSKLPHLGQAPASGRPFQTDSRKTKQQLQAVSQHLLLDWTQSLNFGRSLCSASASSDRLVCHAETARTASFPAGRKQAKIQLPACILTIKAPELDKGLETIGAAITAGATGVLLVGGSDTGLLSTPCFSSYIQTCQALEIYSCACSSDYHQCRVHVSDKEDSAGQIAQPLRSLAKGKSSQDEI